ncbi:MAG: hypothetical protein L0G99_15530, partial [Propionibacteriales bacterium]|nr:hypothetical protein [Propionibacteriales bacterium]
GGMTSSTVRRVVRASATYDLLITVWFALPVSAPLAFSLLQTVHAANNWMGVLPDSGDVFTLLFANLMGSVVTVWAVFRLIRPDRVTALADSAARVLFSIGFAAALAGGASPLVLLMLVPELGWAVCQVGVVLAAGRRRLPQSA